MIDPSPAISITEHTDGTFRIRWVSQKGKSLIAFTDSPNLEHLLDFLSGYFDHSTEAATDEDLPGELRTP